MVGFQLQATNMVASYVALKADSASTLATIEYHLFVDSAGAAPPTSVFLNGYTGGGVMQRDTVIPFVGYFGGPYCKAGVYYEAVYSKVIHLGNPYASGLTWSTFEICASGVRNSAINLKNQAPTGLCASFSVRSFLDNVSGQRYFPSIDTRGVKRKIFQDAYGGLANFNDFGRTYEGADSTSFELTGIYGSSTNYALFESGFSSSSPLPDFTEDSFNGPNVFAKAQGVLWSTTTDTGFVEGNYLVGIRNQHFFGNQLCYKDVFSNVVYYHRRDTSVVPINLDIETPDSSFSASQATTVLRYSLDIGDTLILNFKAIGPAGQLVYLLSDSILDMHLNASSSSPFDYSSPKLISRNIGGIFTGLDSNNLQFFFAPKAGSIDLMRERNQFQLVFGSNICGGDVRSVRLQIDLNQKPKILLNSNPVDTVYACVTQDVKLQILNAPDSIRWEPAIAFLNPRSTIGHVITNKDQWCFLQNAVGDRLDSVYLSYYATDTVYHIDLDSLNERMVLQDSDSSIYREWIISDLVVFNQLITDTFPMIGAGDYRAVSVIDELECIHYSDTTQVPFNRSWSANYGGGAILNAGEPITTFWVSEFAWTCKFRPFVGGANLHSIFLQGIVGLDSTEDYIVVELTTFSGYSKIDTLSLGKEQYVEVPIPVYLTIFDYLEVKVTLGPSKVIQKLDFSGQSYRVGNFEFYSHSDKNYTSAPFRAAYYTLPIGINYTSTVDLPDYDLAQLELYPNPAIGSLRVQSSKAINDSWVLYSLSGTEVLKGVMKGQELNIDVSSLPNGVYLFGLNGQFLKVIVGN